MSLSQVRVTTGGHLKNFSPSKCLIGVDWMLSHTVDATMNTTDAKSETVSTRPVTFKAKLDTLAKFPSLCVHQNRR